MLFEEGNYLLLILGIVIGIVVILGYFLEVFCFLVVGKILDVFLGVIGYRYYFIVFIIVVIIGLVFIFIWMNMIKERCKEFIEMNNNLNENIIKVS